MTRSIERFTSINSPEANTGATIILAIVGSTKFANRNGLAIAEGIIENELARLKPSRVVSGGAEGIDQLGARKARERGIEVTEYLPENPRWDPDGYKARNLLIAKDCTHLLRITCAESKTYGSGWTADRAEHFGAQVDRRSIPA